VYWPIPGLRNSEFTTVLVRVVQFVTISSFEAVKLSTSLNRSSNRSTTGQLVVEPGEPNIITSVEGLKLSAPLNRSSNRSAAVQLVVEPGELSSPNKLRPVIPDVPGTPEADFNIRVNASLTEWENSRKLCLQTFSNAFFEEHGIRPIGAALETRFEALFPEWKRIFVRTAEGTLLDGLDLESEVGLRHWESEYYENRKIYWKTRNALTIGEALDEATLDVKFRKANPQWEPRYKQVASPRRTTPNKDPPCDKAPSIPEVVAKPSACSEAVVEPFPVPGAIARSFSIPEGIRYDVIDHEHSSVGRKLFSDTIRWIREPAVGSTISPYIDELLLFGAGSEDGVRGELGRDHDAVTGQAPRNHL
jgi:hypothetical protein